MFAFLMTIFVLFCIALIGFILIQQGKGDMGMAQIARSTQMLFGGSGGQEFFERITWFLGAVFIFGSLGLAMLKSKALRSSRLEGFKLSQAAQQPPTKATTQEPVQK